jgi:aminoglycoside 6'-N-acetyltransferase I
MRIRHAQPSDRDQLTEMRTLLWPESSIEEQRCEVEALMAPASPASLPTTVLVSLPADADDRALTGFLEVSLRSHADGCDTHPVGFIEGWFIREPLRGRGIGAALMRAAEDWARAQGCSEIASDALIDNQPSIDAHQSLGFEVVDRCVNLRKAL